MRRRNNSLATRPSEPGRRLVPPPDRSGASQHEPPWRPGAGWANAQMEVVGPRLLGPGVQDPGGSTNEDTLLMPGQAEAAIADASSATAQC